MRLPSLNALRAFEAVARHLNLTRAAEELHVTPAAVSHQIKALEEDLGVPLLRRVRREFFLTDAAQAGLPALREAFDLLGDAVERMRSELPDRLLTISVLPSFAVSWLVPRLSRFKAQHPEIDVRLDTNDRVVDLRREGIDLGIRFGAGDYPGLEVDRLLDEEIFPVCSPSLLEGPQPLKTPEDLRHHSLLHVDWTPFMKETGDWNLWLMAAGLDEVVDVSRGPRFSHTNLALQAAVHGQGVVIGSQALAADDLAAGRLVRPFGMSVQLNFCYFVVTTPATARLPKVAAFKDWLLREAAGQESQNQAAARS
ncbi:MAG: transcriptional regulator GcvA [Kiloniellales bacterium]|nr:transcriptional regulator GcvA [Kiloniellales bacterium]MDJ0983729.1 transcriptional regulator GcvA [Kiloniellales bacterium]